MRFLAYLVMHIITLNILILKCCHANFLLMNSVSVSVESDKMDRTLNVFDAQFILCMYLYIYIYFRF